MTWREAVDEAGRVVYGVSVGIGIVAVAQDETGTYTYPQRWRRRSTSFSNFTRDRYKGTS